MKDQLYQEIHREIRRSKQERRKRQREMAGIKQSLILLKVQIDFFERIQAIENHLGIDPYKKYKQDIDSQFERRRSDGKLCYRDQFGVLRPLDNA